MLKITSAEFQRHFGLYQDKALSETISITRNGRERLVVLAVDEYKRLMRRSRQVLKAEELTDDDLALIEQSEVPEGHNALDKELN